jgi:hypothetical protein
MPSLMMPIIAAGGLFDPERSERAALVKFFNQSMFAIHYTRHFHRTRASYTLYETQRHPEFTKRCTKFHAAFVNFAKPES